MHILSSLHLRCRSVLLSNFSHRSPSTMVLQWQQKSSLVFCMAREVRCSLLSSCPRATPLPPAHTINKHVEQIVPWAIPSNHSVTVLPWLPCYRLRRQATYSGIILYHACGFAFQYIYYLCRLHIQINCVHTLITNINSIVITDIATKCNSYLLGTFNMFYGIYNFNLAQI